MPDAWLVYAVVEVVIAPLDSQDIPCRQTSTSPFGKISESHASCYHHVLLARGTLTGKGSEGMFHVHVLLGFLNPTSYVPAPLA